MDQQAMNLLLKLSIDFVQHLKPNQLIADGEFVPIFEKSFVDRFAIQHRAVGRIEIYQAIASLTGFFITLSPNLRMQPRSLGIVDAHISIERPTEGHFGPLEWNRNCQQFSTQKDERRAAISLARSGLTALGCA